MKSPRLMIVLKKPLSTLGRAHIRCLVEWAERSGDPLIFDDDMKAYQLIDGRWTPLDTADGAPDPDADRVEIDGSPS